MTTDPAPLHRIMGKRPLTPSEGQSQGVWSAMLTAVYSVLFALSIRTFAYEPFSIPTGSMVPTLLVGDYLFVSKFAYGYSRHTFGFGAGLIEGRILGGLPERGDVAVFKLPRDVRVDYVKRIIGLPGDRIQVKEGVLHINGTPVQRRRISDFQVGEVAGRPVMVPHYIETLPGGRSYSVIEVYGDQGAWDNTEIYKVPPGHVFAMGDNRDFSNDSRVLSDVGFIPVENLVGKAGVLFLSVKEDSSFVDLRNWPSVVRRERLFKEVM